MKNIFLLFVFILSFQDTLADGLEVMSFKINANDLSARTEARLSNSGKNCALIKIQCPNENLTFEGDIIGNVKFINSEYWVYLDENAEFLQVKLRNGDPLLVMFEEYLQVPTLENNITYNLTLLIDKYNYSKSYTSKYDGEVDGHKYVDLGLSVYWATCNIGSISPNEKGKRYAWGEVSPRTSFSPKSYKYCWIDDYECVEYTNYMDKINDGVILKPSDDAATFNWGNRWRIPNKEEMIELFDCCTFYWTSYDGINGYIVTGPNGNSIFLPYAETEDEEDITEYDIYVHDSHYLGKSKLAKYSTSYSESIRGITILLLEFNGSGKGDYNPRIALGDRYEGYSIRPVLSK